VKILLLLLFAWMPLRQETSLEVFVTCRAPEIFSDYRNANFRQVIRPVASGLDVTLQSRTLSLRQWNHALRTDEAYVAALAQPMRLTFIQVRLNALSVAEYLENISALLKSHISYSESELPQDALAVVTKKKANCIGFCNLAQTLLACVGIVSRPVNGFYLREEGEQVEPLPHRWLEIDLPGKQKIFYDPQYQSFSSRYLVANLGFPLERIERFKGIIVKKSKKIVDE
jgi:transglutaminase-like putative cysteine protease